MQGKKRPEYPHKPDRVPDTSPERLKAIVEKHEYYRSRTHYTDPFEAIEDLLAILQEALVDAEDSASDWSRTELASRYEEMRRVLEAFDAGSDGGSSGETG